MPFSYTARFCPPKCSTCVTDCAQHIFADIAATTRKMCLKII